MLHQAAENVDRARESNSARPSDWKSKRRDSSLTRFCYILKSHYFIKTNYLDFSNFSKEKTLEFAIPESHTHGVFSLLVKVVKGVSVIAISTNHRIERSIMQSFVTAVSSLRWNPICVDVFWKKEKQMFFFFLETWRYQTIMKHACAWQVSIYFSIPNRFSLLIYEFIRSQLFIYIFGKIRDG